MCPHKRAFVLDHGVVGDDSNGNLYVSCPLHKRNFKLDSGECLNDDNFGIMAFEVKQEDGFLLVKLPEPEDLDEAIGTSKWMVGLNYFGCWICSLEMSLTCQRFVIRLRLQLRKFSDAVEARKSKLWGPMDVFYPNTIILMVHPVLMDTKALQSRVGTSSSWIGD